MKKNTQTKKNKQTYNKKENTNPLNLPLPHNKNAERSVLASILLDDSKFDEVRDILSPSDFHDETFATIYRAMLQVRAQNRKIDIVSVCEELGDRVPGSFLIGMQEDIPQAGLINTHSQIIKEAAQKRKATSISYNTLSTLNDPQSELTAQIVNKTINELQKLISDIDRYKKEREIKPYLLGDVQKDLCISKEGLLTGYKELDTYVSIPPAAITLIAGRPGHGKTTCMLNLLINMVRKYPNKNFYFFSYEETRIQIACKIIHILSQYKWKTKQPLKELQAYLKIMDPIPKDMCVQEIEDGKGMFRELTESNRLMIIETTDTVQELADTINWIRVHDGKAGAIFIDYIQKIKNQEKFGTRQLELQKTSEIMLELAKSSSLPIIMGAQLNRGQDKSSIPKLEHLRECGDFEQDSSTVLGVYTPILDEQPDENTRDFAHSVPFQLSILKNRNAETNKIINLEFDRKILTIKETEKIESLYKFQDSAEKEITCGTATQTFINDDQANVWKALKQKSSTRI